MMDKKKKPMPKEGTTGGGSTVPMTPERKAFMKRMQDEEAASKKGVKPNPSKYAKGGEMKKYAKGGSVDGCAKKGKTKAKMVKMAAGGSTGLARAAAMSGRTMPTTGRKFKKGGKMGGCK